MIYRVTKSYRVAKHPFSSKCPSVKWALMLGGFLLTANAALAKPNMTPAASQPGGFERALAALAKQGHVGFIVEGVAATTVTQPTQSSGVSLSGVPSSDKIQALADKIQALAAAYDYDVQAQGSLYLLKKRYTDPRDLPPVSLEECILAAEDVKQVLSALNTGDGPDTSVLPVFAPTLTAAQVQALSSNALTMADLTADQQAMMNQVVASKYVTGPTHQVSALLPTLTQAPQSALRTEDETGQPCFGLEVTDDSRRVTVQPLGKDGSDWLKDAPPSDDTPPDGSIPLSRLADLLNARGQGHVTVEHCLAEVPVTVAGLDTIPPPQVCQAVATLYGLRLTTADSGTVSLQRPLFRVPLAVGAVSECVRRVLPEPLLRALHCDLPEEKTHWAEQYQRQESLSRAAIRSLYTRTITPLKHITPAGRLPITALDGSETRALAVALMTPLVEVLNVRFLRQTPDSITRFDQLHLAGGPYWNANPPYDAKLTLSLTAVDPTTQAVTVLDSFDPITIPSSGPNPNNPDSVPTVPFSPDTPTEP